MNCKQGDLAICVGTPRTHSELRGVIVKIIRPSEFHADHWFVEPHIVHPRTGLRTDFHDASLRPIRDSDGTDETLTWAGLPAKVTA